MLRTLGLIYRRDKALSKAALGFIEVALDNAFGAARMTAVSHELENVLDDLRLGKVELTTRVLDLLFQSVELYGRLLAAERGQSPEPAPEVRVPAPV